MYDITYRAVATLEYQDAIEWYARQSKIAAENFIKEVNDKLDSISAYPRRPKNLFKHYFEISLRKYPYTITYFIEEEIKRIVVVAIYHHKRHPRKKYRN